MKDNENLNSEVAENVSEEAVKKAEKKANKKAQKEAQKEAKNQAKKEAKNQAKKESATGGENNEAKPKKPLNKRLVFTIIASLVVIAGIVAIVYAVKTDRAKHTIFSSTDYPVMIRDKKGNLELTIKSLENKDYSWEVTTEYPEIASVTEKGKQNGGKAKYIVSPQTAGVTDVFFTKYIEIAGVKYDLITIGIPFQVSEVPTSEAANGLKLEYAFGYYQKIGYQVVGENTDHPVVITGKNEDVGLGVDAYYGVTATDTDAEQYTGPVILGNINFVKGQGDWELSTNSSIHFIAKEAGDAVGVMLVYDQSEDESGNENGNNAGNSIVFSDGDYEDPADDMSGKANADREEDALTFGDEESEADIEEAATSSDADASLDEEAQPEPDRAEITLSSKSLGITKKYKVSFYYDNNIVFEEVSEKDK